MLHNLSKQGWKFFLSGNGLTVRSGKQFGLAAVLGVIVGLVTVAFYWMIHLAQVYVIEGIGHHTFISTLPSGDAWRQFWSLDSWSDPHRWALFFLPAIGAILGQQLIHRFARVEHARGTDSAVKAFHRGERIPRTVIPVKSVASVLTVGFGGSAGYEGPVTLIGAACGSVVSRFLKLDARASRILLAAGLAAGISALFRAPLAGAIFGAEIFYSSSDLEFDAIIPSFCASAMAYTVFACFYGWDPLFYMPDLVYENGLRLLPYFALAVVVTYGARFYIEFFRGTEAWFSKRKWPVWTKVGLGGLTVGAIGLIFPDILGTSYPLIQAALTAGDEEFFASGGTLTLIAFVVFFFVKVIATSLTVGSGGSGGLFAPAIVCGGALGAATGLLFAQILPSWIGIHPAAFALVGMAGFLASTIRVPITAIVMVAEISGNHALLLPTMWVVGISFWMNNRWSLYRSQVHSHEQSPLYA